MAGSREKGWWEVYRGQLRDDFLDIAEPEWHTRHLRIATTVHLPGLLQTEEHGRAVFAAVVPPLAQTDVELRTAHRIDRQPVLDRPEPPVLDTIIHEAALRMEFGGASAAKRQLEHLLQMSERDAVTMRVITVKAGGFPGAGQSVIHTEAAVPESGAPPGASRDFIRTLANDLQEPSCRTSPGKTPSAARAPTDSAWAPTPTATPTQP